MSVVFFVQNCDTQVWLVKQACAPCTCLQTFAFHKVQDWLLLVAPSRRHACGNELCTLLALCLYLPQ